MKRLELAILMSICFLCANAQSWQMIYKNDKNGDPLFGQKEDLIKAIREGKDVKIMTESPGQEYFTPAENIWIRNGVVTIQNAQQVSVDGNSMTIQKDAYNWIIMVNTEGVRQMSRWRLGEHTNKGDNSDRVNVTWFVR